MGEISNCNSVPDETPQKAPENLPSALLDEEKRRIWCFGPNPDSKLNNQRYYLPVRFLSVMRAKDIMILPGNHFPTRDLVSFMMPLLGLSEDQIIWTSGEHYSLDKDITESITNKLGDLIRSSACDTVKNGKKRSLDFGCNWLLIPYSATTAFCKWSSVLMREFSKKILKCDASSVHSATLEVFGESEEWIGKYGHKGILHRHMSSLSTKAVIEEIDENFKKTFVPKGYQCSNTEHLLGAYELLIKETSSRKAVIKPILGTSGFGIIFINTAEELIAYDFPMGEVLLEEMLDLDLTEDGLVISPAVHYIGEEVFGGKLVDQLMINTTYFGWRESKANAKFQENVLDMTEKLIQFTKPKGPGGYDFLSVKGQPILSDINTGRFNGAHQPKLFLSHYACPGKRWYCWKSKPSESVTVETFWNALESASIAYHPVIPKGDGGKDGISASSSSSDDISIEGVFPLTYLRGVDGIFIAIADSSERCMELYEKTKDIIASLE